MRRRILESPSNDYEYVDMGLSVKWATCNIGAYKPEDYGLYFAWGETTGYPNATAKPGGFDWTTTPYWVSGNDGSSKWSKYTSTDSYSSTGQADNKLVLEPEDDAAHVYMGGDWRMPTKEEFQELYNACNTSWKTQNGVNGRLFTLKTDPSKQLFFPAGGYVANSSMYVFGYGGYYWSSSLYTSVNYGAYHLSVQSSLVRPQSYLSRYFGHGVRGVI